MQLKHRNRRRKCLLLLLLMYHMRKGLRAYWVHPMNRLRLDKGEFYTFYPEARHFHEKFFRNYRMSVQQFDHLLQLIVPRIQGQDMNFRAAISLEQKLVVTLRYFPVITIYFTHVATWLVANLL